MPWRNFSDHAICSELFEAIDRVDDVEVEVEPRVIEIWTPVTHNEVAVITIKGAETGVTLRKAILVGTVE
jgi:hypothetical protein